MSDWTELYFGVHGVNYRWRIGGFNEDGYPYQLELERYESTVGEWAPVPNHNVRDAFKMGMMAARQESGQVEMFGG